MAQLTPLLLLALVAARGAGAQTYSALLPGFACTRQDAACAALGDLYAATNGAQWTTNTGWAAAAGGVAQDYCTALYKVACNVAGRLTRIDLVGNHLKGTLPETLGTLQYLTTLNAQNCPEDGVGSCDAQSAQLQADQALLTGAIPDLSAVRGLYSLGLSGNALSGPVPAWLGSLTSLYALGLNKNRLSGALPASLGNLTSLRYLNVMDNELSSSLPATFGAMSSLDYLAADNNNLSGSLPAELGACLLLTLLNLASNALVGSIPASYAALTRLQDLRLDTNELSGPIPKQFSRLTDLRLIYLYDNQLSGSLPDLGGMTRLTVVLLMDNNLSGTLPAGLGSLTALNYFLIHRNPGIYGVLPAGLVGAGIPNGNSMLGMSSAICVLETGFENYDYDHGTLTSVLELDTVCPMRTCPADSWSASGLDTDGSAGGCVACPEGSGIADLGGVSTNNTEAHAGGAQCATGDAAVVVGADGAAACAAGLQGAPVFAAGAWAGCVSPPSPPLPPAGGSVASALSLAGVSLDTFNARSVANALASALGVQPAAVAVTVQGFALSTTLSLAGSATSLTAVQRAAIAASLAASLAVPAAQVQLAAAPAAHRRLLQALQVGVTVTGLSSDAAAASQSAVLLAAPATMAALVAGLATPSITGATAAPVVAAAQLGIAVQAPASSLAAVATALSDSGGASLTAALQTNGVAVSGVSVLSPPLVAAPPRPPSPPPAPPSGMSSAVRARIIGGVVGGVLGAAALLAAVLLVRHRGSGASSVTDTTDELKAQMTPDPSAQGSLDGGATWRTFLSRADEVVLGDVIGQGGYASVHAGTWRGTQVAVKVFDVRMQLRLGSGTTTTSSQQTLRSDTSSYGREVELLSSLRHPNILAIYALVERPRAMLVMELGAAGSLRDLLYRTSLRNLAWSKRVSLGTGVACGVDFLHSQKPPVIHLDLKSANVVLDLALVPKVCDFGISAIVGQQDGSALRGTPRFMAPEVARQLTISNFPAIDAYGLGMILHDLAHVGTDAAAPARLLKAGRDPVTALSESASAATAASWAANRILFEREFAGFAATVAPSVPQPLAELIRQCLEVEPEQRPTVERLRLSLAQLVDGAASW